MNIQYFCEKLSPDEDTIASSLTRLGHQVTVVTDRNTPYWTETPDLRLGYWENPKVFEALKGAKAVWIFDPVIDVPSGYLDVWRENMGKHREHWLEEILPVIDVGFFTDGEVVERYPEKAVRLVQGSHTIYYHPDRTDKFPILFAGDAHPQRQPLLDSIKSNFPDMLKVVTRGERVYGVEFAKLIAASGIVVAPDVPIKHNYWSNRVYVVCGAGGFLLHPYIKELAQQYEEGKEIVFYRSREDLMDKIRYWLPRKEERDDIGLAAYQRTLRDHTYLHRVRQMLRVLEDRFGIK